jgi:hypothetical protein
VENITVLESLENTFKQHMGQKKDSRKIKNPLDMVVHAYNPSTQEG